MTEGDDAPQLTESQLYVLLKYYHQLYKQSVDSGIVLNCWKNIINMVSKNLGYIERAPETELEKQVCYMLNKLLSERDGGDEFSKIITKYYIENQALWAEFCESIPHHIDEKVLLDGWLKKFLEITPMVDHNHVAKKAIANMLLYANEEAFDMILCCLREHYGKMTKHLVADDPEIIKKWVQLSSKHPDSQLV